MKPKGPGYRPAFAVMCEELAPGCYTHKPRSLGCVRTKPSPWELPVVDVYSKIEIGLSPEETQTPGERDV